MSVAGSPRQDPLTAAQGVQEALRASWGKYSKALEKAHHAHAGRVAAILHAAPPAALALIAEHSPASVGQADHALGILVPPNKFSDYCGKTEPEKDPTQ